MALDVELIDPPAADSVLTLADVKEHLKVDGTDEDTQIQGLIDAALGELDGVDGILGRCLAPQTWALYLDRFPARICLPLRPLIEVVSISYVDATGAARTLDVASVEVLDGDRAEITPAYGEVFPTARTAPRAVTITFRAGYADGVPPRFLTALKLRIGDLHQGSATNLDAVRRLLGRAPTVA